MITLNTLKNTTRPLKARKRVGRGVGSKLGKTCGRGEKGAGSRAGYKRRWGKEGGSMPLHMKLPIRGFSNARFRRAFDVVNLEQLNAVFDEGAIVSLPTLRQHGFVSGRSYGIKLLGKGELTKQLTIRVQAISDGAREKLTRAKVLFEIEK